MSIPDPKENEKQSEYISRCVSAQSDANCSQERKLAICYSKWRESKKSLLKQKALKSFRMLLGNIDEDN